jgi:toxin ParE1/3/4
LSDKPVVPRQAAHRDAEEAIEHYRAEAGGPTALAFIDALESAYHHIARHPGTGSPRYAHELDLAGLRTWRLSRFPHLVFYVELTDRIDVWRVLHGARDIPATLQD